MPWAVECRQKGTDEWKFAASSLDEDDARKFEFEQHILMPDYEWRTVPWPAPDEPSEDQPDEPKGPPC